MDILHATFEAVEDAASFLSFVSAHLADRRSNEQAWENHTIEDFLEAGLAWANATNVGATEGLEDASPWKRAASLLYAGSVYE